MTVLLFCTTHYSGIDDLNNPTHSKSFKNVPFAALIELLFLLYW